MTNAKLEALRAECARIVLNEDDEYVLEGIIERSKEARPCQYTVEELRERVARGEKEFAEGKGIPMSEIIKEFRSWR